MKIFYSFILVMIVCFPANIFAQDWQCVREGVTTTFVDTTHLTQNYTANTMWVVHIDSVGFYQGWKYHYGFNKPRLVSTGYSGGNYYKDYCYDPHGPSRMGVAMSALGGENFFFNSSGHGIMIITTRQLNQPWICIRLSDTSLLYASVTSMAVKTILGEPDSVKYISFQAKSSAGVLLSHPMNTKVFVLSKHFGMITLFDFYNFPNYTPDNPVHLLAGIKTQGTQSGDQNLSYKEVFSFAPGDEFHTSEGGDHPNSPVPHALYVMRILDTLWNTNKDIVTYRISRYINYWYYSTSYIKDTISVSYPIHSDNCLGMDNLPEQTIYCYNASGMLKSVNLFDQCRNLEYNSRWTKYQKDDYKPGSFCADTLVGFHKPSLEYSSWTGHYISGCGGPYYYSSYTDSYHKTRTSFYELIYFKKGSETWGQPIITTGWGDPNAIPETEQVRLVLYPNPSNEKVTLEIPDSEESDYKLVIFSISGIKISEMKIAGSKFTFDVSKYAKGMYFLKLYKGNLQVGQQKLIKQ